MKHLLFPTILLILLNSCSTTENEKPKEEGNSKVEYLVLSGTIKNFQNDSITLGSNYNPSMKVLHLDSEGAFHDTLFLNDTVYNYYFQHAQQYASLFLKKGYNLNMQVDYSDFDNSIAFNGKGSDENNLMMEILKMEIEEDLYDVLDETDDNVYNEKMTQYEDKILSLLDNKKDIDADLVNLQKENIKSTLEKIAYYRESTLEELKIFAALKGTQSPTFTDYETPDGSTKSLEAYFGKYLYIDIWATWCGPCLAETPHLKNIYNDYKDKGLSVLSISVDKQKSKEKWVNMVHEEELVWNNLITDNDFSSDFIQAYSINSIPRFILLDPSGKIISAGAPRPSSDDLRPLLDSLLSSK